MSTVTKHGELDVEVSNVAIEEDKLPEMHPYDLQSIFQKDAVANSIWDLITMGSPAINLLVSPHHDVVKLTALLPFDPLEAEDRLRAHRSGKAPDHIEIINSCSDMISFHDTSRGDLMVLAKMFLASHGKGNQPRYPILVTYKSQAVRTEWLRWINSLHESFQVESPFSCKSIVVPDQASDFIIFASTVPGGSYYSDIVGVACSLVTHDVSEALRRG